jgi:hypothetical protein
MKEHLAGKDNVFVLCFVIFCSIVGFMFSMIGLLELYKSNTFVIHQCQIKSIDLTKIELNFYPSWIITVIDDNQIEDQILTLSFGSTSQNWPWNNENQYKVKYEL